MIASIVKANNNDELYESLKNFNAPFGFEKPEERGLFNWVDVLNRFDELLAEYVKQTDPWNSKRRVPPQTYVPENIVILVLKATLLLLENASQDTKSVYCSAEYVSNLLSDHNTDIVTLALEVLNSYLKRSAKLRSGRLHIPLELGFRLLPFAQGWGAKEQGLGMLDCVSSASKYLPEKGGEIRLYSGTDDPLYRIQQRKDATAKGPPPILACDIKTLSIEDEKRYLHEYPKAHGYSLMAAFRRARAFVSGRSERMQYVRIRLLALTTLCRIQPIPESLLNMFNTEPELVSDIVSLIKGDPAAGLGDVSEELRLVAIRCLTACLFDRSRTSLVSAAGGVGSYHGVIPSVLRSQIAHLLSARDRSFDAPVGNDSDKANSFFAASTDSGNPPAGTDFDQQRSMDVDEIEDKDGEITRIELSPQQVSCIVDMTEAVLQLVGQLAICASHSSPSLVSSGAIGTILPLISKDRDPLHLRAVRQAIMTLEALVEKAHTPSGSAVFREDGGMAAAASRLTYEAYNPTGAGETENISDTSAADDAVEEAALAARGESRTLYVSLGSKQMTVSEALEKPAPSSSGASRGCLLHSKWSLIRSLLRLLSLGLGHCTVRARSLATSSVTSALRRFAARPFHYGGSLFAAAASLTAQIANVEPTILPELNKAMVHHAIINSISAGLPPSGDAIRCVPTVLSALCLSPEAKREIKSRDPLKPYIMRLATPFYGRAMHGDTAYTIGRGLDEMMRHVPDLREGGNKAILGYLEAAAEFVSSSDPPIRITVEELAAESSEQVGLAVSLEEKEKDVNGGRILRKVSNVEAKGLRSAGSCSKTHERDRELVRIDKMRMTVANNAARLAGFSQGSREHQNAMLKGGGIQSMLALRCAPARCIHQDSASGSSSSSSRTPTVADTLASLVEALRNLGTRDGGAVFKSIFAVTKEDAKDVLDCGVKLGMAWLPEEELETSMKKKENNATYIQKVAKCSSEMEDVDMCGHEDPRSKHYLSHSEYFNSGNGKGERARESERMAVVQSESERKDLRGKLAEATALLRLDTVLLTGLARAGSSLQPWDADHGGQVVAVLATVQRLSRIHLSFVYTSLTVDGTAPDLSQSDVTALGKSKLSPIPDYQLSEITTRISTDAKMTTEVKRRLETELKTRRIAPPPQSYPTRKVTGLGRNLALLVYAISRLYASLARALSGAVRRSTRRSGDLKSIRAVAHYLGQNLTLHLVPVPMLGDKTAVTAPDVPVVYDYLRQTWNDIRGILFDESRQTAQSLLLQGFIAAGGGELLWRTCNSAVLTKLGKELTPQGPSAYDQMKEMRKILAPFLPKSRPVAPLSFILGLLVAASLVPGSHPSLPEEKDVPVILASILELQQKAIEESDRYGRRCFYADSWSSLSRLIILLCKGLELEKNGLRESATNRAASDWLRLGASLPPTLSRDPEIVPRGGREVFVARLSRERMNAFGEGGSQAAISRGLKRMMKAARASYLEDDWSTTELRRAGQVIGMSLVEAFVRSDVDILNREEFVFADVAAVIRLVARQSKLLSLDAESPVPFRDRNQPARRSSGVTPPGGFPAENLVTSLEELGFSREHCREALLQVGDGPNALNQAVELLFQGGSQREAAEEAPDELENGEQTSANELAEEAPADENATDAVEAEMMDIDSGGDQEQRGTHTEDRVDNDEVATNEVATNDAANSSASPVIGALPGNPLNNVIREVVVREDLNLGRAFDPHAAGTEGIYEHIISMAGSLLSMGEESSKSPPLAESWPVSRDSYIKVKQRLFSALEPLCVAAIAEEDASPSAKDGTSNRPFFIVELLRAMEHDGFLSNELRLKYATLIVQSLSSVASLPTAAVWAQGGGRNARRALLSANAWSIALSELERVAQTCINNGVTGIVPNDGNAKGRRPSSRYFPSQHDLAGCSTCFLVLDALLRYAKIDEAFSIPLEPNKVNKEGEAQDNMSDSNVDGWAIDDILSSLEAGSASPTDSRKGSKKALSLSAGVHASRTKQFAISVQKHLKTAVRSIGDLGGKMGENAGSESYVPGETQLDRLLATCIWYLKLWRNRTGGSAFLAMLQVLGSLTAHSAFAEKFRLSSGLPLLLACEDLRAHCVKNKDLSVQIKCYTRTILRHVAEDPGTLTDSFVEGIRILGMANRRSNPTLHRMLSSCSEMIRRDLHAFVRAFAISVRSKDDGTIEFKEYRDVVLDQRAAESLSERPNIVAVVGALVEVLVSEFPGCVNLPQETRESHGSQGHAGFLPVSEGQITGALSKSQEMGRKSHDMVRYSLIVLQELVKVSPACASALFEFNVTGERKEGRNPREIATDKNSIISFILREVLSCEEGSGVSGVSGERISMLGLTAEKARGLFETLCVRSKVIYETAVLSLAEAAREEAEKSHPRASSLKGFAMCISNQYSHKVVKTMFDAGLADSLATCLSKLELSQSAAIPLTNTVLSALEILGEASLRSSPHEVRQLRAARGAPSTYRFIEMLDSADFPFALGAQRRRGGGPAGTLYGLPTAWYT